MDIEGRGWNFDKLIQIFNPAYAEEIAKIKIPPRSSNDFVAWHVEKIGLFSIRSAYNLALKIKTTPQVRNLVQLRVGKGSCGRMFGVDEFHLKSTCLFGSWPGTFCRLDMQNLLGSWSLVTFVHYAVEKWNQASMPQLHVPRRTVCGWP